MQGLKAVSYTVFFHETTTTQKYCILQYCCLSFCFFEMCFLSAVFYLYCQNFEPHVMQCMHAYAL